MAPPHLLLERPRDRVRVEFAPLLADHDLKRQMQEQVSQFVAQRDGIAVSQRLVELERFFDQVRTQGLAGLAMVPGAAGAQVAHERECAAERSVAGYGRGGRGCAHA